MSVVIATGHGYTITSHGNGAAYEIKQEVSGRSVFIQGDEASLFRAEYDDIQEDQKKPGTRASRFSWRELLDTMCGSYFN